MAKIRNNLLFIATVVAYLWPASPGIAQSANKLALIIGIDEYKSATVSDLRGAVNDAMLMRDVLIGKFDVHPDNILTLTNAEATHANIIEAFRSHLIDKAEPDDVVILHYSGHGSQMRDASGDEIDGRDETIVPHDSRSDGVFDISDDELNGLLQELTQKTKNVTVILDSCHSGAGLRGGNAVRSIPFDNRPPPPQPAYAVSQRGASDGADGISLETSNYVLISGSRADQLSNETRFEGKRHGVLTWFLARALRAARDGTTYQDVMDTVRNDVVNRYPSQEPQLEGKGTDLVVFGVDRIEARPYVLVDPVGHGTVKIRAGKVFGIRNGAVLNVYPPGTRDFKKATSVAVVEVSSASDFDAQARIVQGDTVQSLSRAILEAASSGDTSISVHIAGEKTGILEEIETGLKAATTLSLVENSEDARIIIRREEGRLKITSGDLEDFLPSVAVTEIEAAQKVIEVVKDLTHWLTVLGLENLASDLALDFTIRRKDSPPDARPPSEVLSETPVTYTVTNNSAEGVYLTVLDVSSDGSIALLFPLGGEKQQLLAGQTLEKDIEMYVPEGYGAVVDTLKVIATTQPIDASVFPRGQIRTAPVLRGGGADPLTRFLDDALRGVSVRAARPTNVDAWTTRQITLRVRRETSTLSGFSLYFEEGKKQQEVEDFVSATKEICGDDDADLACSRVLSTSKDGSAFELTTGGAISTGQAFDEAYDLQDRTQAKRVEPNLEVLVPGVVTERGIEKRDVGGDDVHDDLANADPLWSLKQIRIFDAWKMIRDIHSVEEGREAAGILIAHPDTGYTEHPEVWKEVNGIRPLDISKGYNYYEGQPDPKDPLLGSQVLDNPGHGTASGSVIVSPAGCQMPNESKCADGIARGAQLIPLRVHRTVAQFNTSKLAKAIDDVAEGNIDGEPKLISIAMGGPPSYGLWQAVKKAEEKGILIVAASGNYVRTVVWPARFPSTIAVAATNVRCGHWKHSSRGDSVDISAPGESVWRASLNADHDFIVGMSKGTTFATGNIAGAAALWLTYHRDKLDDLRERGAITKAFRKALRKSAWRPDVSAGRPDGVHCDSLIWDERFGPGILDAAKLLEASPDVTSEPRVVDVISTDRLPLFASLYPSGTVAAQIVGDYLAIFQRSDENELDELERFETEILHHYTLDENVRQDVEQLIGQSRASRNAATEPVRNSLEKRDISRRLREALQP